MTAEVRSRAAGGAEAVALEAHLEIFGFAPSAVQLEATPRGTMGRALRAALALVAGCSIGPLLLVLPPHLEPAVLTVLGGVFFARKYWRGRWIAVRFSGDCPRCAHPLRLRAGSLLAFPHGVSCRHCHDTPQLVLGAAQDAAAGVITRAQGVLSPEQQRAADRAWLRRRRGLSPSSWSPASTDWAPARHPAADPGEG